MKALIIFLTIVIVFYLIMVTSSFYGILKNNKANVFLHRLNNDGRGIGTHGSEAFENPMIESKDRQKTKRSRERNAEREEEKRLEDEEREREYQNEVGDDDEAVEDTNNIELDTVEDLGDEEVPEQVFTHIHDIDTKDIDLLGTILIVLPVGGILDRRRVSIRKNILEFGDSINEIESLIEVANEFSKSATRLEEELNEMLSYIDALLENSTLLSDVIDRIVDSTSDYPNLTRVETVTQLISQGGMGNISGRDNDVGVRPRQQMRSLGMFPVKRKITVLKERNGEEEEDDVWGFELQDIDSDDEKQKDESFAVFGKTIFKMIETVSLDDRNRAKNTEVLISSNKEIRKFIDQMDSMIEFEDLNSLALEINTAKEKIDTVEKYRVILSEKWSTFYHEFINMIPNFMVALTNIENARKKTYTSYLGALIDIESFFHRDINQVRGKYDLENINEVISMHAQIPFKSKEDVSDDDTRMSGQEFDELRIKVAKTSDDLFTFKEDAMGVKENIKDARESHTRYNAYALRINSLTTDLDERLKDQNKVIESLSNIVNFLPQKVDILKVIYNDLIVLIENCIVLYCIDTSQRSNVIESFRETPETIPESDPMSRIQARVFEGIPKKHSEQLNHLNIQGRKLSREIANDYNKIFSDGLFLRENADGILSILQALKNSWALDNKDMFKDLVKLAELLAENTDDYETKLISTYDSCARIVLELEMIFNGDQWDKIKQDFKENLRFLQFLEIEL